MATFWLAALAGALAAGVAAQPFCGVCANGGAPPMENTLLTRSCVDAAATISAISFASYGTPRGTCPAFSPGACAAPNTLALVSALCLGKRTCSIYPNTTTFSDPCFGTAKVLAVVAECSVGSGSGTCGTAPPPPPPPPLANFSTTIEIDYLAPPLGPLRTEPSLQVVSQHLLFRGSPIAEAAWATLKAVGANNIRWVPWIPYPATGVGELMPPSGAALCTAQAWAGGSQSLPVRLDCGATGGTVAAITFASYGRPTGNCGNYSRAATCHAPASQAVVEGLCLGRAACDIPMDGFGQDGCAAGSGKWLAVQAVCSNASARHTYWNLTLVDAFMSDFWAAVDGNASSPIPNFSTQPTGLFSPGDYNWVEDPNRPWYGYDRGTAPAADLEALGDYYGRLWAYFILNGFTDEYGNAVQRTSGPPLNISIIEVFNEVREAGAVAASPPATCLLTLPPPLFHRHHFCSMHTRWTMSMGTRHNPTR
jgi:hypothetical protein